MVNSEIHYKRLRHKVQQIMSDFQFDRLNSNNKIVTFHNRFIVISCIRFFAMAMYSLEISTPMNLRLFLRAILPVVPLPHMESNSDASNLVWQLF